MLGSGLEGKLSGEYSEFCVGGEGDGVIPRALKTLFEKLGEVVGGNVNPRRGSVFDSKSIVNSPSRNVSRLEKYSVMCSYMQVYNEQGERRGDAERILFPLPCSNERERSL